MGSIIIDWFASMPFTVEEIMLPESAASGGIGSRRHDESMEHEDDCKERAAERQRPAAEREKKEMTNKNRKERFPAHLVLACIATSS